MSGGRAAREDVQNFDSVFHAVPAFDLVPEHDLLAEIVHGRLEDEPAALLRPVNRPAGQTARHFDDVLLRVAAVHAQGVQLHQFPGVILVQAAPVDFLRLARALGHGPPRTSNSKWAATRIAERPVSRPRRARAMALRMLLRIGVG